MKTLWNAAAIVVIGKKAVFILHLYYQMQHKSPDEVIEILELEQ